MKGMLLPHFSFHKPATIEQACRIMSDMGAGAKLIAGGTDLIVNMKKGLVSPENVVSLGLIKELKAIEISDETISIGAFVTAGEIAGDKALKKKTGALCEAAGCLGSPLIRNLATIAGNLISARPAADFPPPLLCYGAAVVLQSASNARTVRLDEFFLGPGETVIRPDEIMTKIVMDIPEANTGAGYVKLGVRNSLEISLVNVGASISLDDNGIITMARIVLGSVAPTPIRAPSAEKALVGKKPSEEIFSMAGEAASSDSRPIDDFRASAEYKRDMVMVLTKRALTRALETISV